MAEALVGELLMTGAADAREEAYRLLAQRAPARVLVDPELPVGTWVIVRGPTEEEQVRAVLAQRATEARSQRAKEQRAREREQREAAQ